MSFEVDDPAAGWSPAPTTSPGRQDEPQPRRASLDASAASPSDGALPPLEVPDSPLAFRLDDEEHAIRRIWAYTRAGDSLFVALSTVEGPACPGNRGDRDAYRVAFHLHRQINSEGGRWRASSPTVFPPGTGLRIAPMDAPMDHPANLIRRPEEAGDRFEAAVDIDVDGVEVVGRLSGRYCGDEAGLPEPEPRDAIAVTIGGERIPIRGARFLLQDELIRLQLSSAGTRCEVLGAGGDVIVEIRRTTDDRQREVYVSGHRFPVHRSALFAAVEDNPIGFYLPSAPVPGERAHARVAFSGNLRGLPVAIDGEVDAVVCSRL